MVLNIDQMKPLLPRLQSIVSFWVCFAGLARIEVELMAALARSKEEEKP